ncbi:G3E family GTPase [Nocardioides albertanoniae]|uniref:G3E family GTPase n=1 Tax=Nocardioides albertanoniae TaxID=1175486 RepID=A0A543A6Z1_9ACTN|nr:GTP-binding protein [Nocardioides albertanoniae]TQL68383.1 G3E family GTPase [Nocardioides albertanoniae]
MIAPRPRSARNRERTPVILVSGVEESSMLSATISLQFGLPDTVIVRHAIDPERQLLTRIVSDLTGVIEHEEIGLAHACVACAIREDIVPTLERLASQGRWRSVVACLPVAAEAIQVCRVLAWAPRMAPHITIAAVVAALDGTTVADDLLGPDLLDERGLATSEDDRRGVAEVAGAIVEYADVVCLTEPPEPEEQSLVATLAQPRTPVVTDPSLLDAAGLVAGVHRHHAVEAWVAEVRREPLPPLPEGGAWRLDLRSERPIHPMRFQDELETLGGGPRRSRGCFWVPTRPDDICVWDGAGGQASVGSTMKWGRSARLTRIVVMGLDEESAEISGAFERALLTDTEIAQRGQIWEESWDGLEDWLGPIGRAA